MGYHGLTEAEIGARLERPRSSRQPKATNVPRAYGDVIRFGPMDGWNERTQVWDCVPLQFEDETEEEIRYAAFLLYLDTHVA